MNERNHTELADLHALAARYAAADFLPYSVRDKEIASIHARIAALSGRVSP
jgi:hypothetical protein